jgi:hypothetical protein
MVIMTASVVKAAVLAAEVMAIIMAVVLPHLNAKGKPIASEEQ